jgi:hypothetical protein
VEGHIQKRLQKVAWGSDRISSMKRTLTGIGILFLLAAASFAADATGKWKATFEVPNGPILNLTFDLKAVDADLTGTISGMLDHALEIKDGKIKGDDVSFWITSEYQGNPIKLMYTGKVTEGQIQFTMGTEDGGWSTQILAKKDS